MYCFKLAVLLSGLMSIDNDCVFSLCHILPGLSKMLLPRINPLALLGCASTLSVLATYIAIDLKYVLNGNSSWYLH